MICVTIGRGRHQMMIAEHKHIAEHGAELVELRLDYIRRPVNMKRLLAEKPCPVIATCRKPDDGGKWMRTEEERIMLLRSAIVGGADYVDIEMEIADQIPRYGSTQRIVSYHNFEVTPQNIEDIHHKMCQTDADIIKIATMANNPIDNIRLLRLVRDSPIPTVAFCMGEMGLPSRVLCGKFGSPLTYATVNADRKIAPGQLSFEQMQRTYGYDNINSKTEILGVIADPVAHSFSPQVHNACLRAKKLNVLYLPFRVPAEYLDEFMSVCPEMGIKGLSVTIPHKQKVLKSITSLDDTVAGIKAANTVVFKDVDTLGFNTDCTAAVDSLEVALKEAHPEEEPFTGRKALILGAGGAARAIAFGLKKAGAEIHIAARDLRKSQALADAMEGQPVEWEARGEFECDMLINCTPVGMHPNMDASPFEADWLKRTCLVFDTVYNPEQTLLIKNARERGCPTVTGIDMFVRQAAKQFELFTGKDADLELIRYEVKRAISAAKY